MTEEQRTPGPWTVAVEPEMTMGYQGRNFLGIHLIHAAKAREGAYDTVAVFPIHTELSPTKANAAFIVKACNCHDELVAACEALLHDYKGMVRENRRDGFIIEKVEDAIAKAKQ